MIQRNYAVIIAFLTVVICIGLGLKQWTSAGVGAIVGFVSYLYLEQRAFKKSKEETASDHQETYHSFEE